MKSHKPTTLKDAMNLTRDLKNVLPRTKYPPSLFSLPNSRKVRNHGKMNPLPKKIKEYQENNNLEERIYVSHANNLGFRDISVQRGRHTTLKFSLKMMKRGRRRRKHNLQPKKRGMKQKNKSSTLPRQEKLQYS